MQGLLAPRFRTISDRHSDVVHRQTYFTVMPSPVDRPSISSVRPIVGRSPPEKLLQNARARLIPDRRSAREGYEWGSPVLN
jgi:hypothetical protein